MRILVTGGAGFIGSNLAEALLQLEGVNHVRVLDNLATGSSKNIEPFLTHPKFEFIEGDIREAQTCLAACVDIDLVSHQAALGSVPRSINDPLTTNEVNITGMLNMLTAARESAVQRVVYAASSSTYGDHPGLPKVEDAIGKPLSPYAVTKYVNELYADVFYKTYGLDTIGLRYFNVFGPKQDPNGAYAAVIPLFMKAVLNNEAPHINGDGETSRDFTFIGNVVQANIKALFTENPEALNQVYNVAFGERTTLNELFEYLKQIAGSDLAPIYGTERVGDVRHSLADISKAKSLLSYDPKVSVKEGLKAAFDWYRQHHNYSYSV
ncbi:MAG: Vi polysaccharide biosynthesis protein VipB/TviC [Flaviaesturariibacter sp.]|nr:Vi polysaccharide biosynthesis protein VipB/TviC [Flaviaesturariibacter sp.]